MDDPDAPGGKGFVHWIMWNLELVSVLPEDIPKTLSVTFPIGALQGINNFGRIGYSGPCPPGGQTHRYDFKVYGLDTILPLAPGSGKDEFIKAMTGHVVQFGETSVQYGR
jgi:Raf kinase inhibitor-like YbhB/YbcL family protein